MTVLIHQLLTSTAARNWIDDCAKRLVSAQRNLKCHQYSEQRRSRDETQFWLVDADFVVIISRLSLADDYIL